MNASKRETIASTSMATKAPTTSESGIDAVRQILVGEQMKEHEKWSLEFQSEIRSELRTLRLELSTRLTELETYTKGELRSLESRSKKTQAALDKTAGEFDDVSRELRDLVLERSKFMNEQWSSSTTAITAEFRRELQQLSANKLEHSLFVDFLSEWAVKLEQRPTHDLH